MAGLCLNIILDRHYLRQAYHSQAHSLSGMYCFLFFPNMHIHAVMMVRCSQTMVGNTLAQH